MLVSPRRDPRVDPGPFGAREQPRGRGREGTATGSGKDFSLGFA